MSTYLELCRNVINEGSIGGGSSAFPGVAAASGEFAYIVRAVNLAYLDICNRFIDWKFLWKRYEERLPAGVYIAPEPSVVAGVTYRVRQWKYETFWLDQNTDDAISLHYVPWDIWGRQFNGSARVTETPSAFTVRPDGRVEFDTINSSLRQLHAEYYCRPAPMTANQSLPLIPENFHRLIELRALVYYGNREDAPEIIAGAAAEYDVLMPLLESDQLEGWQHQTMGSPDEVQTAPSFDR